MNAFLSRHQCGFRKGYSTQQCLFTILEKWRSAVDNEKTFGALLTDLSKVYHCLSREFLFAMLHAYEFCISALRLLYSFWKTESKELKLTYFYVTHFTWWVTLILLAMLTIIQLHLLYVSADAIDEVIKRLETAFVNLFK